MKILNLNNINEIQYTKADKSISTRKIIPTYIPSDLVTSIEVSDLSKEKQAEITSYLAEYMEYKHTFASNMFNFEDWLNHTHNLIMDLKWRSFKINQIS